MEQQRNGQDTARRVRGKPFKKGNQHRFKKGEDPRRNAGGRPKSFDCFRAIAQRIAQEVTRDGLTEAEALLREWRNSPEPTLQKAFAEYAFGKVPDKLETTGIENKSVLVLHFDHERGITQENEER